MMSSQWCHHHEHFNRVEDIHECQWSGGFPLDKDAAFHIHMRGNYGHSVFVRCEVALKRATYHIIFSDAANYPSPFRLENLSQVSVSYSQSGFGRPKFASQLNPGQSIPYAWDEITRPKKLCLQVKGSRESQELDFETFGARGKLYYESYFYIAAAATFPPKDERSRSTFHAYFTHLYCHIYYYTSIVKEIVYWEILWDKPFVVFTKATKTL